MLIDERYMILQSIKSSAVEAEKVSNNSRKTVSLMNLSRTLT